VNKSTETGNPQLNQHTCDTTVFVVTKESFETFCVTWFKYNYTRVLMHFYCTVGLFLFLVIISEFFWIQVCVLEVELDYIQCESEKNPPWGLVAIFPKRLGIFQPNFTRLLRIPIYARLPIFIQLSASLTKLCHIKRDHPVKIMWAKCPPSAKTHFLTFFSNS